MKKHKKSGLQAMQQKNGYLFVFPWIIGLLLFFFIPVFSSMWYSFCEVKIEPGKIITNFVGLSNFRWLLGKDPDFLDQLASSVTYMLYSFPMIIAFSLAIAVMLNKKFFGRSLLRALFFLPIVITASAVLPLLGGNEVQLPIFQNGGITNTDALIDNLNIPGALRSFVGFLLNSTTKITYNSAVQILLFLGGLQNIPYSLYEVSKIEGANKWEEFWFITVPSLRHIITLVILYTMIDLFASSDNVVVQRSYDWITTQDYNKSSSSLWLYFVIVSAIIGIVYAVYNRLCIKKWE